MKIYVVTIDKNKYALYYIQNEELKMISYDNCSLYWKPFKKNGGGYFEGDIDKIIEEVSRWLYRDKLEYEIL